MGWRGEAGGGSGGLEKEEVKPRKKGEWTESACLFFYFISRCFTFFLIGNKLN